jgi:hypothetical protein
MTFETAMYQWEDGARRVAAADPDARAALERVSRAILDELRRRLGGVFTAAELAELYDRDGVDWALDIALAAAPGTPAAWDAHTAANAAFHRYLREATDYAGGRRIAVE